ncbi:MAG: hypothetical protein ABFD98_12335 [Syntrophobacteraceae bacterium]|nr:hypothetical protein [Desulfobacteraceae bacterium]
MFALKPDNLIGSRIGQFQVDEFIARGAMGMVFKGFDTVLESTRPPARCPAAFRGGGRSSVPFVPSLSRGRSGEPGGTCPCCFRSFARRPNASNADEMRKIVQEISGR